MREKDFSIEIENFKSFKDKSSINIKPLTLIYGLNQSGKSIALRTIGLLSDSIFNDNGPIDISSQTLRGETYLNLGHFETKTPSIKINNNAGSIKLKFSTLDDLPGSSRITGDEFIVNEIIATGKEGIDRYQATFDKIKNISENKYVASYILEDGTSEDLVFDSFFPNKENKVPIPHIDEIKTKLSFLNRCQWIQASRITLDYIFSNTAARCCNPSGMDLVYKIKGQQQDKIINKANEWLNKEFNFEISIKINEIGRRFFSLKYSASGGKEISLEKSSEGVRSIVPILICCYWAYVGESTNSPLMIIIEEPESHLHPKTQINFFNEIIVDLVNSGIYITIETHSVYILRSLQKSILDGKLKTDDVSLNWIDKNNYSSTINSIKIKPDSTFENWRPDIYEDEQKLSHEIIAARFKKIQSESAA